MELTAWNWELDGWIIVAGVLCALSASLLGNYLVLRRLSLLGDAITHAVLPGLAIAFLISESRSSLVMYLGAVVVGLLTAFFTEWIRGAGRVDEGASMGVVFTTLFALGLVLIVYAADRVDLDPNCVLFGSIESVPLDTWYFLGFEVPRAVFVLTGVTLLNLIFVVAFYKELKLSAFDPALSDTLGFPAAWLHYGLMVLVAITSVACFESVGSVLVVAMFVVPAASALMVTDRLPVMLVLSGLLAIGAAISGHWAAVEVPRWFGFGSTSTSGMIAVMCGVGFTLCASFGPRYGIVTRWIRQRRLAWQILHDDLLGWHYRADEKRASTDLLSPAEIADELGAPIWQVRWATRLLTREGFLTSQFPQRLTESGKDRARQLVRSHRLWEQYLVEYAELNEERIHEKAEMLEHFTDRKMRQQLDQQMSGPEIDPHGSVIPGEEADKS